MFDNIGRKMKIWAKVEFWIAAVGSIAFGITMAVLGNSLGSYNPANAPLIVTGVAIMILGPVLSYLGSFFLYGMGELIENSDIRTEQCLQKAERSALGPVASGSVLPSGESSLLKRGYMFLEDGEWQRANLYFERVLDDNPENAKAYMGQLLSSAQVSTVDQLRNSTYAWEETLPYKRVMQFGEEETQKQLKQLSQGHDETMEKERLYQEAIRYMNAGTEESFCAAMEIFEKIPGYKDADEKIEAYRKGLLKAKYRW